MIDLYRREKTAIGGLLSIVTLGAMGIILIGQIIKGFMTIRLESEVGITSRVLSSTADINIDISFPEISCERLQFDVADSMGTRMFENPNLEKLKQSMMGCRVNGRITVNRVPGNVHFFARYGLNQSPPNITHVINHLSFGTRTDIEKITSVINTDRVAPLDGQEAYQIEGNTIFEYYLKVVSSTFQPIDQSTNIEFNQITAYRNMIPASYGSSLYLRFDFSPMSVEYKEVRGESLYDFLVELMAVIGGMYTVASLLESAIRNWIKMLTKTSIGKVY
jgi:hypothetical protein